MRPRRCWPLFRARSRTVPDRLGHLAEGLVEDQLRVAEDGVQRGPELVAHVGQELGLVLAGDRELAALLLDLAEEPGVLDGQRRLGGERLQELDDLRRELSGRPPVHRERADDLVLPQERHCQQRPVAYPEQEVSKMTLIGALLQDVGHLHRLPPLGRAPNEALAHPERHGPEASTSSGS